MDRKNNNSHAERVDIVFELELHSVLPNEMRAVSVSTSRVKCCWGRILWKERLQIDEKIMTAKDKETKGETQEMYDGGRGELLTIW